MRMLGFLPARSGAEKCVVIRLDFISSELCYSKQLIYDNILLISILNFEIQAIVCYISQCYYFYCWWLRSICVDLCQLAQKVD